ncbi:MAG: tetratricopeptide repeat protein [Anaerolineales bacterium]
MVKRVILLTLVLTLPLLVSCRGSATPEVALQSLDEIQAQMDAGNYRVAVEALQALTEQEPENAEAYFLLGLSNFNLGNFSDARAAFERTLELDSGRAGAVHHNLGALAYQMGDLEEAVSQFQAALELEPEDPDTHYQLGATYLQLALPPTGGPPDSTLLAQAEGEFNRALELAPGKAEALVGLGNVYLQQGNFEEAIEALEQALEKNPEMPEALFALGGAYLQTGQISEARDALQRFLETNPPAVYTQQAQDLLQRLEE